MAQLLLQVSNCKKLDKAIVMCEAGSGRAEERVHMVFENMKVHESATCHMLSHTHVVQN